MFTPLHLTFTGAEILLPDGLACADLSIAEGRISTAPAPRAVALPGCRILPGIVDLHGDGFERHLAPRRGLMRDMGEGLAHLDAELAASGITTAVLAQFWSWEGGMRGPDFARAMAVALDRARPDLLSDMQLQLRLETHLTDQYDEVAAFVAAHAIRYLVFNDHLPHEALERGRKVPRLTGQALKSGRSPEAHLALIQALHARSPGVPAALDAFAARLAAAGVRLGSHDDTTAEGRTAMRARGVDIAEFPETEIATRAAHAGGDAVILGAPNVVRGGSHAGKQSAEAAIRDGLCDVLVSDYHYPSLRQAALQLVPAIGLQAAWDLVSASPARLMGWEDRGRIAPGLRADLVILDPAGRVGATLSGGRIAHAAGLLAHALFAP